MLHKGFNAYDRIVAPVMGLSELPKMKAGGKQRPVHASGKLLKPRMQGFTSDRHRHRLDNAGIRIGFHQLHQARDAVTRHDAVRVKYDHVTVVLTPAPAKVGDVAAFALDAV